MASLIMGTLATLYEEIWRRQRQRGVVSADRLLAGAALVPTSLRLLDVGCGDGALGLLVREKVREVHGIEWAEYALEEAEARGVHIRRCDLNRDSFPYPDESFDVVTCLDVIEHVLDPRRLLQEIRRVLRPTGALILTTPNVRYVHFVAQLLFRGTFPRTSSDPEGYDGGHIHYFTFSDCAALLAEAQFTSIEGYGLYRWARLTWWGKIKEAIKGLLGEKFRREFFSSAVVIRAKRP